MRTTFDKYPRLIAGGGGGGGGSESQGGKEENDTLSSKSSLQMIELIGEGQIGGIVNGEKGIFINNTQLVSESGGLNFDNVTWAVRNGTQDQTTLGGDFNSSENVTSINKEIKNAVPYAFTISDPNAEFVKLIMATSDLSSQDKEGNIGGSSVSFAVAMSINGGASVSIGTDTFRGKSRSLYQRQYRYNLPKVDLNGKPAASWTFTVSRTSPDASDSSESNAISLYSYASGISTQLSYPNSAVVGISLNAEQFSSLPTLSYLVDGLLIRVPSNRNNDGTYSGIWDGSFKLASADNPAWILYDIITNETYGVGQYVDPAIANPSRLYEIGRYCDELVDDGFGNKERRFTINTVISDLVGAFDLIMDICSVFNGMAYWTGSTMGYMCDMPTEVSMIYTDANIFEDSYNSAGGARKDRHSVVLVSYNDPEDSYNTKYEYIEDPELIARFGVRKSEIAAFGCTTRGQAHRVGKWLLYTEKYQSSTITFSVGVDSAFVMPGDVVQILTKQRAGRRNGGRITKSTLTSATLDAILDADEVGSEFVIRMPDGTIATRLIKTTANDSLKTTIFWDEPLSSLPVDNSVWIIKSENLEPLTARVVSVVQNEEEAGKYDLTVLEHNPQKYEFIESGVALEAIKTTTLKTTLISAPSSVSVVGEARLTSDGNTAYSMNISWPNTEGAVRYNVKYRKNGGNWISLAQQVQVSVDIENIFDGIYEAAVQAVSMTGARSAWVYSGSSQIQGSASVMTTIPVFVAQGGDERIDLSWTFANGTTGVKYSDVQVCDNYTDQTPTWNMLTQLAYPTSQFALTGQKTPLTRYFRVRLVDNFGNFSDWSAVASAAATLLTQQKIDEALNAAQTATDFAGKAMTDATTAANNISAELVEKIKTVNENLVESISLEAGARLNALAVESQARSDALAVESQARSDALAVESKARIENINKAVQQVSLSLTASAEISKDEIQKQIDGVKEGVNSVSLDQKNGDTQILGQLNTYKSTTDGSIATIVDKVQVTSNAQQSTAEKLSAFQSQTSDNFTKSDAKYSDKFNTLTNADTAISERVTSLDSSLKDAKTGIEASANSITGLTNRVTKTEDSIATQSNSLTKLSNGLDTANSNGIANSTAIKGLDSRVTANAQGLQTKAENSDLLSLQTAVANNKSSAEQLFATKTELDSSEATLDTSLKASFDSANASIQQAQNNAATDATNKSNSAQSTAVQQAQVNTTAYVQNYAYSKVDADSAMAGKLESFNATLQIGGRNLLRGTASIGNTGKSYLNLAIQRAERSVNSTQYVDGVAFGISSVIKGEYTVSFYARASKVQDVTCFFYSPNDTLQGTSSTGQTSTDVDGKTSISVSQEWKRYWITWRTGSNADSKGVVIGRLDTLDSVEGRWVEMAGIKFEQGNKATDWSAAPEDIGASIDLVSANLSTFKNAQVTIDKAQTDRLDKAESTLSGNTASIQYMQTTYAKKDEVGSLARTALSSAFTNGVNLIRKKDTLAGWLNGGDYNVNSRDTAIPTYFPCVAGESLTSTIYQTVNNPDGLSVTIAYYDSGKNYISGGLIGLNAGNNLKTAPDNASYFRIAYPNIAFGHLKVERGSVSTSYSLAPEDTASQDTVSTLKSSMETVYQTKADASTASANLENKLNSSADGKIANALVGYITQSDASKAVSSALEQYNASFQIGGRNLILDSDKSTNPITLRSPSGGFTPSYFGTSDEYKSLKLPKGTSISASVVYKKHPSLNDASNPFTSIVVGGAGDSWAVRFRTSMGTIRTVGDYFIWSGTMTVQNEVILFQDPACVFVLEDTSQNTGLILYKLKVELGSKPTDWTAAPEDTNANIANVSSSLGDFKQAQATLDQAQSSRISSMSNTLDNAQSAIQSVQASYAKKDEVASLATTALKSKLGIGGNLLSNSDFSGNDITYLWQYGGNYDGLNVWPGSSEWTLQNTNSRTMFMHSTSLTDNAYDEAFTSIAVNSGLSYQISAYTGAHRCKAIIFAYYFDGNGKLVGNSDFTASGINNAEAAGGRWLSGYKRIYQNVTVPQGAVVMQITIRRASNGGSDPYLFFTRVQASEILFTDAPLAPWSLGGSNLNIGKIASASALEQVYTKTDADSAMSGRINTYDATMTNKLGQKLDASVIASYYTKTEVDKVTSGKIESYDAGLSLGGNNIQKNSDFALGTIDGFNNNGGGFYVYDDATFGKQCVITGGQGNGLYLGDPEGWKIGQIYTLSVYVKNATINLQVDCEGAQGISGAESVPIVTDEVWRRFVKVFKKTSTGGAAILYLTGNGQVSVGRIQLERGSKVTDWSPSPVDIKDNLNNFKSNISSSYQALADKASATATGLQTFSASLGKMVNYTIGAWGGGASGSAGVWDAKGNQIQGGGRSWNLTVFNPNDGSVTKSASYDVYGQGDTATNQLISDINALPQNTYVALYTSDEPSVGRSAAFNDLVVSLGGNRATLNKIAWRSAYLLMGRKGFTEGQGTELYNNITNNATLAVQFINGVPLNVGGITGSDLSPYAKVSDLTSVKATADGINATKMVTVDNNGVVAGYGIVSDLTQGKVTSAFGVNADQFYVGSPNNGRRVFSVANGKTIIDSALVGSVDAGAITSGTISSDRIGARSISADKLSVASLDAISAQLGIITTYRDNSKPNGARMVITGGLITVFDDNNVMRVRLGLW